METTRHITVTLQLVVSQITDNINVCTTIFQTLKSKFITADCVIYVRMNCLGCDEKLSTAWQLAVVAAQCFDITKALFEVPLRPNGGNQRNFLNMA